MIVACHDVDPWVRGVYLVPDAVRILRLPAVSLRTWVGGRNHQDATRFPAGPMESEGRGRDRHFGFLTLVLLYTVAQLRERGVSMAAIRDARDELAIRFKTDHPFALGGLLGSGKTLGKSTARAARLAGQQFEDAAGFGRGPGDLLEAGSSSHAHFVTALAPGVLKTPARVRARFLAWNVLLLDMLRPVGRRAGRAAA